MAGKTAKTRNTEKPAQEAARTSARKRPSPAQTGDLVLLQHALSDPAHSEPDGVLALQRAAGNRGLAPHPGQAYRRPRQRQLRTGGRPTEDLESAILLQYYIQLPFELDAVGMERVAAPLPYINRRLVVGHLGIAEEERVVHYRYVQALQSDELITRERVADVVKLVTFSPHLFGEIVEKVGTGAMSLAEARAAVGARYVG